MLQIYLEQICRETSVTVRSLVLATLAHLGRLGWKHSANWSNFQGLPLQQSIPTASLQTAQPGAPAGTVVSWMPKHHSETKTLLHLTQSLTHQRDGLNTFISDNLVIFHCQDNHSYNPLQPHPSASLEILFNSVNIVETESFIVCYTSLFKYCLYHDSVAYS